MSKFVGFLRFGSMIVVQYHIKDDISIENFQKCVSRSLNKSLPNQLTFNLNFFLPIGSTLINTGIYLSSLCHVRWLAIRPFKISRPLFLINYVFLKNSLPKTYSLIYLLVLVVFHCNSCLQSAPWASNFPSVPSVSKKFQHSISDVKYKCLSHYYFSSSFLTCLGNDILSSLL